MGDHNRNAHRCACACITPMSYWGIFNRQGGGTRKDCRRTEQFINRRMDVCDDESKRVGAHNIKISRIRARLHTPMYFWDILDTGEGMEQRNIVT